MMNLVKIGEQYLNANSQVIESLRLYYNAHCMQLVDSNRRYNMQQGDDWCMMFLSVLAHKAGLANSEFPYEVSVYYAAKKAKAWGVYKENTKYLREGDLVVYDWGGRTNGYNHVGIVKTRLGDDLQVLEGNYSGSVGVRSIGANSRLIRGAIMLDKRVVNAPDLHQLALDTIRGKYGNGAARVRILGDNYHAVQREVNRILGS